MRQPVAHLDTPFYAPLSGPILIKGAEEGGKWIVYLQASNEMKDQDNEYVEMGALKKAADYFLSHGVISWDHKHKSTHDPGFIIGEPLDVKFTADRKTLVKAFLYKQNEIAKKVWSNIKSGAKRLGASIGGGILQKAEDAIKQVVWDETAITHKPVNDGTLGEVQMVPFAAFAKALTAGSGVDASLFTGGRALAPESLHGSHPDIGPNTPSLRKLFADFFQDVRDRRITTYNDAVNFVYRYGYAGTEAIRIVNYLSQRVPALTGRGGNLTSEGIS